jgi:hypothetical protein
VERRERGQAERGERARGCEVAARHAEEIAEEQAVEAGRRGRRQREEDAEPEERRDDDRDRDVAADPGQARRERDRSRGAEHAARRAEEERQPEQRGRHEPGEERVRQRLGAVGELVEDDPAAEHGADDADEEELEQRPLHERVRPGLEQRVNQWWCGGSSAASPGRVTISPP